MRLIDDSSECNFLDNRCQWLIKKAAILRVNKYANHKTYMRK